MKLIESEAGLVVPVMSACISAREGRWFVFEIPRGDTNGVSEDEVTLTSWLHAAQRRKKTEKRRGGYM